MKPGAEDITELDVRKQLDYREYLEVTYSHFHDSFNCANILSLATSAASVLTMLRLLALFCSYRIGLCITHSLARGLAGASSRHIAQSVSVTIQTIKVLARPSHGEALSIRNADRRGTSPLF